MGRCDSGGLSRDRELATFLGPGVESGDDHDKYLARVGVAYANPVSQRWAIVPEFIVDIIEGGATTYVLGAAVGFGF